MRPRPPLALVLALSIALPAAGLRAEDAPRTPKPKDGGFRFSPPEGTEPPPGPPSPAAGPAKPAPASPMEAAVRRLATWPSADGVKAAESLVLQGPEAIDAVLAALTSGDASLHPGAAWVLGKIGAPDHVPHILRAAANRTSGTRLEVFFEAALELDPALTKKWLFSFLTLERPVFRARATEFLAGLVTEEDRPRIDGLLRAPGSKAGVRIAGLELLARTKAKDAPERIADALGDPHPDVARRASELLAATMVADESLLPRANALARDADARQRAYATLALVEFNRRGRVNGFEPATIPSLMGRRGLLHPDRLSRGSAALGLAFGALDSSDPSIAPLLDGDVISVLIDTVGGDHFLDYGSLLDPCFAALRRLAGVDLPSTASPWAQWWLEHKEGFHARRTLVRLEEADVPRSRVLFDLVDADGRRRRSVFVPEGADADAGAFRLPLAAYSALVGGLEDAGMFQQGDDPRTLADEHLAVRLGVANQEKRMVLVPSREDPRYATLLARLEALEEANLWQRYRDADEFPDAAAWWRAQSAAFAGAEPEARRAMLVHLVAASFDDLDGDGRRMEALDLLERTQPDLTDADATLLLGWASSSPAFGAVESRLVKHIAALDRPALAEPAIEALSRAASPEAQSLLADTLAASGPIRVREAMADPRAGVRSGAARAAADLLSGPTGRDPTARERMSSVLEPGLKALLADPDVAVRARAAASLTMLGDGTMLARLEEIYREGDSSARIVVAECYGRIGGSVVQPLLVRILGEQGAGAAPVRAAALKAMAASRNPDAVRILAFYMLSDGEPGVQQAAEAALVGLGDDDARRALVDAVGTQTLDGEKRARALRALATFEGAEVRQVLGRHLEDEDPRVVDQAAIGLGAQRDAVAVPYLLAILKRPEDPSRQQALEALQDVTSLTLLVTSFGAAADQYEAWYRAHRSGNDRSWFRDAVERRGYDVGPLVAYARGEDDIGAVPVLLRTIRDDDPVIRRNSDLALRRCTGYAPPRRIDRSTSRDDAERVAERWASWWARRPQGPAGGKR